MSSRKTLSIRLDGGGLSYSVLSSAGSRGERYIAYPHESKSQANAVKEILEAQPELQGDDFSAVQILIDTTDTVFVPEIALSKGTADSFLNEAGIFPGADKKTVVSPSINALCAVMSFDAGVVDYLSARFGVTAGWFSPLQENLEVKSRVSLKDGGYIVNLTEKNMYVTSFNSSGHLLVAEAFPYISAADIVYYLTALTEYSASKKDKIYLYGYQAKQHLKVVKKYFKGVSRI